MTSFLHRLTPKPPLGWNSFDCYGCFANEAVLLSNLEVFAEKVQPCGYEYFTLDAGWYRQYEIPRGRRFPVRRQRPECLIDEWGRYVPAPCFFPRGLAPVVERAHELGVKFGIHVMRGIPRRAVAENTEIAGSSYHACDIADTEDTCKWCEDNYGIDMSRPGAQAYYDSVIDQLAGWGVDFIKYDDIVPSPSEVDAVVNAIENRGRDIVLSLSPGNNHDLTGMPAYRRANMMRISGDIWDSREDFRWVFERWELFAPYVDDSPEGFWLDQDMIPFGRLRVCNEEPLEGEENEFISGRGRARMSELNRAQKRTFMSMQALGASPLFMGGDLTATDEESFNLITHPGMLACNQNGVTGRPLMRSGQMEVWKTPRRDCEGEGWVGIFNRQAAETLTVELTPELLRLPAETVLEDVWAKIELGALEGLGKVTIDADDVLFLRYRRGG